MKWLRRMAFTLCVMIGALLLLVAGLLIWLQTESGGRLVRDQVLSRVDPELRGEVGIGRIAFRWDELILEDVVLRDPEGDVVAEADRVVVDLAPTALLGRELRIDSVRVEQPGLYVVQDEAGTNLQRALEPSTPKPDEPEEKEGALPFDVVVAEAQLVDGRVTYDDASGGRPLRVRLEGLGATARVDLTGRGRRLEARVDAEAALAGPVEGPMRVHAELSRAGDRRKLVVNADAAGARLDASATVDGEASLVVDVRSLEVPPGLARAFSSNWPLQIPVTAHGTFTKVGGEVAATAEATAGHAIVDLRGRFDLDRFTSDGIRVEGRGIDLSEWVTDGPASDLSFTFEAAGGGRSLEALEGAVTLGAPESTIGGEPFGPVRLHATAEGGRFRLRTIDARVPGAVLTARGEGDLQRLHVFGTMAARDLAALSRTLGALVPGGLPLAGRGALAFDVRGRADGPSLTLTGRLPWLRYAGHRVRDLELRVALPDAFEPLARDGRIHLRARDARVGEHHLVQPRLKLQLERDRLALDVASRGSAPFSLTARGEVDGDRRGLTLSRLTLRYPEATWRLEGPTRLRVAAERFEVARLALRSGEQRIAFDLARRGRRFDVAVGIDRFSFTSLPRAFVGPSLRSVRGPASLEGRLSLHGGAAEGSFKAQVAGLAARGTFDLPLAQLRRGGRSPVSAKMVVEEASLAEVLASLGRRDLALDGRAGVTLDLGGTASRPTLHWALTARDLTMEGMPPVHIDAVARTDGRGRLELRVDAGSGRSESWLAIATPWTLARLFQRPPTLEQALRSPFRVEGRLRDLPLPVPLRGTANPRLVADVDLHGTPLRPGGTAKAEVGGLTLGDTPIALASVGLRFQPRRIEAQVHIRDPERELVAVEAALGGTIADLRRRHGLATLPVSLDARWGPLNLTQLPDAGRTPLLDGLTTGTLRASGTLQAPRLELQATVHGLGSAGAPSVGDVAVRYRYVDGRSDLEADALAGRDGRLRLRAALALSLSWDALQRGLDWRRAELDARLEAKRFDPAFLSGISPQLVAISGRMEADITARGPLGLPNVAGVFEWQDGRLALEGSGNYERIHVLVRGTDEQVRIEEVLAHAGHGSARIEGVLTRAGEAVDLDLGVRLSEFPIVAGSQKVATVSTVASARGTASVDRIDIPELRISEAVIERPERGRKDLQPLEPPKNVTFYVNGEPVTPKPERREDSATGGAGRAGDRRLARDVNVQIQAPRNLWVRGDDVDVEIGLGEGFRAVVDDEARLFGEVHVLRGRFSVLGRDFELSPESVVTFGGPPLRPRLNVVATHENTREDVLVTLRVTGQGDDIEIQPSSDPPMPETEIYTLVATGRRSLRPGTTSSGGGAGATATGLVGSLIASRLQQQLEAVLPLDVLRIEAGERGVAGTRVQAGTYVTDRLFLGIESQIGARRELDENQNELQIEYQLWKRWQLELRYGDAREGSGDLIWRKRY